MQKWIRQNLNIGFLWVVITSALAGIALAAVRNADVERLNTDVEDLKLNIYGKGRGDSLSEKVGQQVIELQNVNKSLARIEKAIEK
ncbi:MAG: hypothetical protein V4721_00505 [Bacteroidota bacterium]